ncbi:D-TA family PLP-dependent enzyme [Mucilaginibacter sp. UR6-1]|uniref:D-TA family PLP-dependent enzyme n=1 Tax=Mucilaginibacter sp. UR6-1 TaxID=1435643 RepID=UPI001E35BE3B|nr:D-TA family PLP-dependent enzyme [Mucilaginibacter sp. UR6-1]MCC8408273.1 D-TA family PLP-dependent enzyme [Mucilaginibacter sp. UR6-1]
MEATSWYAITDINKLDTPALVVYPDRVKHNIELLKQLVGDTGRLRPHLKSHKSADALRLNMQAGITKFKCATIAEAEMAGLCLAPDVLLAYQPVGPKLERFVNLIKYYPETHYSCLVDSVIAAKHIAEAAFANKLVIDVYIDINVGMNRTGIAAGADAIALYIACSQMNGINLRGLHAYDGHIHDADIEVRRVRCEAAFEPLKKMIVQLKALNYTPLVIAGGTPTLPVHLQWKEAECSPGTYIYWDVNYEQSYPEQPFLPAALLVTRVVSLPDETKICVDLGHKSISAENPLDKRVVFLNAPELTPVSHSEEHMVLEAGIGHTYQQGDVLYGLPYHICPGVALYERAITIENGHITGEWKTTARDRKINF